MKNKKHYLLCTDCIFVKGYKRSAIYDLTRSRLHLIPNLLYKYLNGRKYITSKNKIFTTNSKLDGYFDLLLANEILIQVDVRIIRNFPSFDLTFNNPVPIDSIITKIDEKFSEKVLNEWCYFLRSSTIKSLVIYAQEYKNYELIEDLLETLSACSIVNVIIILNVSESISSQKTLIETLLKACTKHNRITKIYIGNYKELPNGNLMKMQSKKTSSVFVSSKKFNIFLKNLKLMPGDISFDIENFLESKCANLFYNRKLFMKLNGEIYLNGEFKKRIGNIYENKNLIFQSPDLVNLWKLKKDEIDTCCDCELRYACPDQRIPVYDKIRKIYFNKCECGYNPYIAKWEGEKCYIPKEQWRAENSNWESNAKSNPLSKKTLSS